MFYNVYRSNEKENKEENFINQSKNNLHKSEIQHNTSLIERNSLDVSEFYLKQCKLIDDLLQESPKKIPGKEEKNKRPVSYDGISKVNLNKEDHKSIEQVKKLHNIQNKENPKNDPELSIINKPILIKNKIIHNLKHLQRPSILERKDNSVINQQSINNSSQLITRNVVYDYNQADKDNSSNIDKSLIIKLDNSQINQKTKMPAIIHPPSKNYKYRCISANNSSNIRNNSNNIRRVFNQDLSYLKNDNSFLHNASALPVIPNNREYCQNKNEKPIRLKIKAEMPKIEKKEGIIKNNHDIVPYKYYSDKNVYELKNLINNNQLIQKIKNVNYHYNDTNNKVCLNSNKNYNNYNNFNRLIQAKNKINEQRPFSHLNGKNINLDNIYKEKKYVKGINMGLI